MEKSLLSTSEVREHVRMFLELENQNLAKNGKHDLAFLKIRFHHVIFLFFVRYFGSIDKASALAYLEGKAQLKQQERSENMI